MTAATPIKFYVMQVGQAESDYSWMVSMARAATVNKRDRPAAWVRVPILSFLVVHPEGNVLFDTGYNPDDEPYRSEGGKKAFQYLVSDEERLEARLAVLGLSPGDIDIVVVSHLHDDHAGNLRLFKDARVLVNRAEFAYALVETHISHDPVNAYLKRDFDVEGLRYELVEEDMEILPGVEIIVLEGHAAGLLGLVVHLKDSGTVICTSDAVYTKMNYGPPEKMSSVMYDSLGYKRSLKKIRSLQQRYHARIIFGHDPEQYSQELIKFPGYYT